MPNRFCFHFAQCIFENKNKIIRKINNIKKIFEKTWAQDVVFSIVCRKLFLKKIYFLKKRSLNKISKNIFLSKIENFVKNRKFRGNR